MVDIKVGDVCSTIISKDLRTFGIVRNICKARPDGFQYMPRFREHKWDGYISLMQGMSKFPTGLLNSAVSALEDADYSVNIIDDPHDFQNFVVSEDCLNGIILRDYQIDAATRLLRARRGVAKMATNSGKTEVISAILSVLDCNSIVIVSKTELLYQTAERIEVRTGCDVGKIGDGVWDQKKITVAMIQTLDSRGVDGKFDDNVVLMVDECHHVSSDTMLDAMNKIPGCYRFGFSGTPLKHNRLADLKLIGATGEIVCDVTNEDMVVSGYSAVPVITFHVIEGDGWGLSYHEAYEEFIVNMSERNEKIADIAKESAGVTLILVNRIVHGDSISKMVPGSIFVHGGDTTETRLKVLTNMRDGKAGTYIASPIFDEGIDVPSIDTLILAAGGKSHIKLLQRVGRGLRRKEGENVLFVHDFIDDTNEYLLEHSNERNITYVKEKFECRLA